MYDFECINICVQKIYKRNLTDIQFLFRFFFFKWEDIFIKILIVFLKKINVLNLVVY